MFLESLDRARLRFDFDLFAFVVMPENCHVMVCPRRELYDIGEILTVRHALTTAALNTYN